MQNQTLFAPLVAVAWPESSAVALNKLYEALTFLLVEDYDVLILTQEKRCAQIQSQLESLNLPDETVHFLTFESSTLSIAQDYRLIVRQNEDGSEFVDLNSIEPEHRAVNFSDQPTAANMEYISCENKILVPIYDNQIQEEVVMDISQQFPSKEVIALDCEILNHLQLKLSDLILFTKD